MSSFMFFQFAQLIVHYRKFTIFCAEQYKYAKKLTGRQLDELFSKYRVWDYLYACYEALHTTGTNYIIHDIDFYIDARKPAMA